MRPNNYFPAPQKVFDRQTASAIRDVHVTHTLNGDEFERRMLSDSVWRQETAVRVPDAVIDKALATSYGYGASVEGPAHGVVHLSQANAHVASEGFPLS